MELQLKKVEHDFYEKVDLPTVSCETMRESIVPDSCADIARIVDTTGVVCLTSRDMMADGRFSASGTVDVSVLYIPEKGGGISVLRYQIPFQCNGEGQEGALEHFDVHGELQSIDTRVLNPRKVLTRVNLILHPSGCRKVKLSVCSEGGQEEAGLQLLRQKRETKVIASVREKEFSFIEELPLAAGREGVEEVLSTRLAIRCSDCKIIGNKVVVKGVIAATVLYRAESGGISLLQQELPFSQIIEGGGMEESWECHGEGQLLGTECYIGAEGNRDDRHILTLTIQMRTRVTIWRMETVDFVADLYSTAFPVKTKMEEITLQEEHQRQSRRINGRELLETGVAVKGVVDTAINCGKFYMMPGSDQMEIPVWARCLYIDENDMLHSVEKSFRLPCPAEAAEVGHLSGWADCRGDVMASILPEGIELRFPLECTLESWRRERHLCVAGVEQEESSDAIARPSLVLRKFDREESLWSVAKQYCTTCQAILEANEIETEQQIPTDRLLLIPRARA